LLESDIATSRGLSRLSEHQLTFREALHATDKPLLSHSKSQDFFASLIVDSLGSTTHENAGDKAF
jgi:hypothetical protein